jgi:hypothetical protein
MKKTAHTLKKLVISRETVCQLENGRLDAVVAAAIIETKTACSACGRTCFC